MTAPRARIPDWFKGELIGTFLLVFFGVGAVGVDVAYGGQFGLLGVAALWGLGLAVAIAITGPISGAHLNPAVTLAFARFRDFPRERILPYFAAQFLGAFLAATAVFLLCAGGIQAVEMAAGIERGSPASVETARIFLTFYPHPHNPAIDGDVSPIGLLEAIGAEFLGTALLALTIFGLTSKRQSEAIGPFIPILIGVVLTVLIAIFAPVSMAGFNPARDLGPRLLTVLAGWDSFPLSVGGGGWVLAYLVTPCLGALAGAATAEWLTQSHPIKE